MTIGEQAAEKAKWILKPRGIGSNVDIYTFDDKRIIHDVPYRIASTLKDAHNSVLAANQENEDTELLDWLDSKSNGDGWVARESIMGRGYRLHNTKDSKILTVRAALRAAREEGEG